MLLVGLWKNIHCIPSSGLQLIYIVGFYEFYVPSSICKGWVWVGNCVGWFSFSKRTSIFDNYWVYGSLIGNDKTSEDQFWLIIVILKIKKWVTKPQLIIFWNFQIHKTWCYNKMKELPSMANCPHTRNLVIFDFKVLPSFGV